MSDDTNAAAEFAERAAQQASNAVKNTGRAVKAAAEPVMDEVRDQVDKLDDAAEAAVDAASRVNPRVLSRISGDTGVGFLALSVSITSAAFAYAKFRAAYANRSQVIS